MFDRWALLLVSCALAAMFVALAAVVTWYLRSPTGTEPPPDGDIFVPAWSSPFAPRPSAPAPPAVEARRAGAPAPPPPAVEGVRFRILPGSTITDVLRRLAADSRLTDDLAGAGAGDLMARLGLGDRHAEGQFLPDAYHVGEATTASEILREAHDRMRVALATAWRGRSPGLPYATPEDALIVASIVERETALAEDRPRVAAVFARRMHMGMRLQADPTVLYGLGGNYGVRLTRRHLTADTPYNTYTRNGLPPTPIALPGIAAIEAALHPAPGTTSLYFVGRGDGTTEFSDTLAEHNAAVQRYRRDRRRR